MEEFVSGFGELSSADVQWLQNLYRFTAENILPVVVDSEITCKELSSCLFHCLCRICHNCSNPCCSEGKDGVILPLSYRFISLTELQSQQKTPCCSQLTWSTSHFKQWTLHEERFLVGHKVLSRTNLLLCGVLTDKISITPIASVSGEQQSGGNLYLQDKNGFIPCEIIKLDARWLGHLVLFPSWSYIPQSGAVWRPSGTEAGYLEIIEAPFPVFPKLFIGSLLVSSTLNVFLPDSAIHLLDKGFRCHKVKLNIAGELRRLSPVLSVRGKTFFFFFLSSFETDTCLPVVVQVPTKLMWHHCLEVSKQYVVTKVFVSSLQGTSYKVFVVSSSSDFYLYNEGSVKEQTLVELVRVSDMKETVNHELTSLDSKEESSQNRSFVDWSNQNTIEEVFESKESKIISYRGMISKVLNITAGLYELDGKFGLCVAYQQVVNCGRGLRPGAQVEIHDAHLHLKESDHFPRIILCCCLRSALVVMEFSRLSTEYQPYSSIGNIYISLLFKYNLDLPNYLWVVHIVETLIKRFCPCFLTKQHMVMCDIDTGVIGMFFNSILKYARWNLAARPRRDIYLEILAESHHCPLKEISQPHFPCQSPSLSELLSLAEERAWRDLDLASLLPDAEIKHLIAQQLNSKLAWSFDILNPEDFQPQMILTGVFQANSKTGCLQLLDTSGALDCIVHNSDEVNQVAFSDTSYIGCLVQLQKYQLVIERFICSEFPSSKHLDDPRFIKEKHTRIYAQFCAADLQVLKRHAAAARTALLSPAPQASLSSAARAALLSPASQASLSSAARIALLSPAPPASLSSAARTATRSSCSQACKNGEVNSITSNQHQGSPSLPKMPRLEEVVLQEGHVGESRRTVCSHPLWSGGEAVGIQGEEEQLVEGTGTSSEHSTARPSRRKERACSAGCVTQLLLVTHKDALMLRNCQYGRKEGCEHTNGSGEAFTQRAKTGLGLAFQASAVNIGSPRQWKDGGKIEGLPEIEEDLSLCSEYKNRTQMLFMGKAVKWYHLISQGGVYRLIASKQLDTSIFKRHCSSSVPRKTLQRSNCPLYLVVRPEWKFQYISTLPCLHQSQLSESQLNRPYLEKLTSEIPHINSVQDVLSHRSCYEPNRRANFAAVTYDKNTPGISVPGDWGLKLTVGDTQNTAATLNIYVDLLLLSYTRGILPGALVVFYGLERTTSRYHNVYCKYVPSSSASVLIIPSLEAVRSASTLSINTCIADMPLLYLGSLISGRENHRQGIVCCHVVTISWLKLQWICSRCSSIFKQGKCTRSSGPCLSAVAVFRANASVIVEDGTAEARVHCKDKQVADLLALSSAEWEGLQQHVGPRGKVYFQYQGRTGNELHEETIGDVLMQYLGVICTSTVVCRPIQLAFRFESRGKPKLGHTETFQLRTVACGDHQYVTKMAPALSLTCLDIKEVDYRMLCRLANDRLIQ
ncbi:CST complex subunit CTC1 isoform X2 [Scyliorhinus torazame]|uniref:CST complex subunit CTC1 isoform X2 n=1 Tax=Scyliorhinus torazame TaxID=75743 RepID=UPI003B5BCB2B